jgi:pimeloyl-ACP methyl ester carboxylesterase
MGTLLFVLTGCWHSGGSDAKPSPGLIPLADFFKNTKQGKVTSPSGTRVARLQPGERPPHRRNVFVREGKAWRQITQVEDRDIDRIFWFSEKRIGYLKDAEGEENYRLFAVDADGRGRVLLGLAVDGLDWSMIYREEESVPFRALVTARYPDFLSPVELAPDGRSAKVLAYRGRDRAALFEYDLVQETFGKILKEDVEGSLGDEAHLRGPGRKAGFTPEAMEKLRGMPVAYAAQDGLIIPGFLYLPRNPAPGRPGVVLCHGGPEAMTAFGNDPMAMLLADRGIAVLDPNFRGSAGFGKTFRSLGYGQWGRAMEQDLVDGARWLVSMGHAEPGRIALAGGSYGGYAAMIGAAQSPDVFCCAMALAGVYDLFAFLSSPANAMHAEHLKLLVGDPRTQAAEIQAVSPSHQAHRIQIPVLVAHGDRDARCDKDQADRMVAALRAQGRFVPYLVMAGEGHLLNNWREETRIELFRAVENFFGLHLESRVEAPASMRLAP